MTPKQSRYATLLERYIVIRAAERKREAERAEKAKRQAEAAAKRKIGCPRSGRLRQLRQRAERAEENRRFTNRRRFDQGSFWRFDAEPRSYPPSSWPAFEDSCRKWGLPVPQRVIWSYNAR